MSGFLAVSDIGNALISDNDTGVLIIGKTCTGRVESVASHVVVQDAFHPHMLLINRLYKLSIGQAKGAMPHHTSKRYNFCQLSAYPAMRMVVISATFPLPPPKRVCNW